MSIIYFLARKRKGSGTRKREFIYGMGQTQTRAENERLRDELREEKGRIRELRRKINSKEKTVTELERIREERDATVSDLRTQLNEMDRRNTELRQEQISSQSQLLQLRQEVKKKNRNWVINRNEVQLMRKILGKGAWGSVVQGKFRCSDVAVKKMHGKIVSPHNIQLFEREIDMASRCRHPCLLQFIGATADDKKPLLVTELMDTNLRKLYEDYKLTEKEASVIFLDVALALNYLHQNIPEPIIHRDISSANVLLWKKGKQWRAKVSDYGTANFVRQCASNYAGAVPYCAPEVGSETENNRVSCKVSILKSVLLSALSIFLKFYIEDKMFNCVIRY